VYSRRGFYKFLNTRNSADIHEFKKINIERTKGMQIKVSRRSKGYLLKLYDISGEKSSEKYLDLYLSTK
jgi:hypothetical protein